MFFEQFFYPVIFKMRVANHFCPAEPHTVDQAGMAELVCQDKVTLFGQGRQQAYVDVVAGVEDQGSVCTVELCQVLFQLSVPGMGCTMFQRGNS